MVGAFRARSAASARRAWPTHVRHGAAADRGGASRRPGATVGTQFSLRDPLPLASDVERVSAVLAAFLRVVQGCIEEALCGHRLPLHPALYDFVYSSVTGWKDPRIEFSASLYEAVYHTCVIT